MVVIRLSRSGAKKRPFYHIMVADKRRARDGKFIEKIGFFNPMARGQEERLRIDMERAEHWVSKGAQPSARVKSFMKNPVSIVKTPKPKKKAAAPVEDVKVEQATDEQAPAEDGASTES